MPTRLAAVHRVPTTMWGWTTSAGYWAAVGALSSLSVLYRDELKLLLLGTQRGNLVGKLSEGCRPGRDFQKQEGQTGGVARWESLPEVLGWTLSLKRGEGRGRRGEDEERREGRRGRRKSE